MRISQRPRVQDLCTRSDQGRGVCHWSKPLTLIILSTCLFLFGNLTHAQFDYFQGFEDPAWETSILVDGDWQEFNSDLLRVPSGYDGINSAGGDAHAIVAGVTGTGGGGPYTRFGGYRTSFEGGFQTAVDVYIDLNWNDGEGFDFSVAANRPDNSHLRDFIAHVGKVDGAMLFNASNNSDSQFNGWKLLNENGGNNYTITTSGWYTIEHEFVNDEGVLLVNMSLKDSNGTVLHSLSRSNPGDLIDSVVGGNRYGWFVYCNIEGLAVDNSSFIQFYLPVHNVTQDLYYSEIQAAIDDANDNDVIQVSEGSYDEVLLIDKPISLFGPNSGISAVSGTRLPEAQLLQRVNISQPEDVTISGFEFFEVPATTTWTVYIYGNSNNLTFQNNRFINIARGAIRSGDGSSTGNLTVTGNLIQGITTNDRGLSFGGVYGASTISDNKIDLSYNGNPTGVIGLLTPNANGLTISGNEISNVVTQGLQLSGSCGNVVIENNTIYNTNNANGADRGAIRLYGTNFTDVITITGNTLSNSFNGIAVRDGEDITGKDIIIEFNDLSGNSNNAVYNGSAAGTLTTNCNWFGSAELADVQASISGDVEFVPYLISGSDNEPMTPGFQPAPETCSGGPVKVFANDTETTPLSIHASIQDGINAAVSGNVVQVDPGTYDENIVVNKALTLNGPNADIACGSRGAEALISPTSGLPVSITADGVTFNGFEITAPNRQNAIICSNTSNLNIAFNYIHDVAQSITPTNVHTVLYVVANSSFTSNVNIVDNCIENISNTDLTGFSASAIGFLQSTSTGEVDGVTIARNSIDGVTVNNGNWPTGKIAYGVLMNAGGGSGFASSTGNVKNAVIEDNVVTNLSGFISTAIGLEGNTENAVVSGNDISNLSGRKTANRAGGGFDLSGLKIENNKFVGTLTISENSFQTSTFEHDGTPDLGYAVSNYVNANDHGALVLTCNWFGLDDYDSIIDNDDLDGKVFAKDGCEIEIASFLTDGTDGDAAIGFQPAGGACLDVIFGCSNPGACNYDDTATLDDGSCDFSCYGCLSSDPSATLDDGTCELCFETEDFDGAITLSPTQQADAWHVDRWAPAGFLSNASFDGGQRLRQIISEFDGGQYRGAQSGAFYDTQGRKYDLPSGSQSLEIELYIPASWETIERRMAGIWGTAVDAGNSISAYPIIEFSSEDANPRFKGWGPNGWTDIGLPTGFAYNEWYTLTINMLENGEFLYTVSGSGGDVQLVTIGYDAVESVEFSNVILQGHNTSDGVNYFIHWDNFTYGSACSEFLGLSYEIVPGTTIDGYTTYRVYADFGYEEDELQAVYGIVDANENTPLSISTTGDFYQDPFGGLTTAQVNPAVFASFPDAEFDSYLALGAPPQALSIQVTGISAGDFTTNGLEINGEPGGVWFITPGDEPLALAGNNPGNRVLIGQFTTNGIIDMNINLQYQAANGVVLNAEQVEFSFPENIEGCTDSNGCNYNPLATLDDGSCIFPGCTDELACNYIPSAGCDDGSCDYTCLTAYYINDNDTTDDVFTTAIGDDNNTGTTAAPFATFAQAISVASVGDTIYVDAGSYAETVIIDKGVVILGPNHELNPNNDTRIAEAILHPPTTGVFAYQFDVTASDVTIKGVTFDGDNPNLTSGFTNTTGADIDGAAAIEAYESGANSLIVENNIIRNYFYFAITIYPYVNGTGTPSSGHIISNNLFEDLGTYDTDYTYSGWGGAVLIHNNAYAKIENNVINNARIGVQTGNFYQPTPNPAFEHGIRNNEINTRRVGIFHNLAYSNASEIPVSDNVIMPYPNNDEIAWTGLSLSSLSVPATAENNTIDGSGALTPTLGISVWNVSNAFPSEIIAGSITNVDTGIFMNNFEGYNSNGTSGAHANITAMVIDAFDVAISLYDSPSYTGTADAEIVANIANCFISSENDGIVLEETRDGAVSATINDNFIDAIVFSIEASTLENNVDATCNWFGSELPSFAETLLNGDITFIPLLISGTDDQPGDPGFYPEAGACFEVIEGCTNPSACNYDENATNDNGTCEYDCIICDNDVEEGVFASFAEGTCTGCDEIETFSTPIQIGNTQADGVWYTDRYAPSVFAGGVSFLSGQRLRQIISEFDGGQYRGAQSGSFYDTQGRKYDLPANTRTMKIDVYVPASWETTDRRMAGFWGTAYDATGTNITGYPILEFASIDGEGLFRAWDNGVWVELGLPTGFAYNTWHTLEMNLLDNGQFLYRVGDLAYATTDLDPNESQTIGNVILQGHNNFDGVNYVIHWDDFEYSHGLLGCTDITACNFNPDATCDDGSCIPAVVTTTYNTSGPDPINIGSGISNNNMAVSEDCNVSASIKAFNRFMGDITPTGNLYRAMSGNSPTSSGDPTPVPGLARWNYLISVNLGDYTFEDLNVYLDIDFDPDVTPGPVYEANLSQFMILNGLGATSMIQDSQNLGFDFWQTLGDPAILPLDPFANGEYDLNLRIETLDGTPVMNTAIVVEVFTEGCTDSGACNYDADATDDDGSCEFISCADCANVPFGTASIDDCGVCSGGTTGITPNSSCTDCAGVVNGDADIDACGVCAGGTTGVTPDSSCTDCAGVVNGDADIDACGVCAGGTTGITPDSSCTDCAGLVNGDASIDDCGVCSGGTTGITPNSTCLDCAGVVNGTAFIDDCDDCVGGTTGETACVTCLGDFNQDGAINASDLLVFIGNWECTGPNCIGDLNNDGVVNSSDLGIFISLFGTFCQ